MTGLEPMADEEPAYQAKQKKSDNRMHGVVRPSVQAPNGTKAYSAYRLIIIITIIIIMTIIIIIEVL